MEQFIKDIAVELGFCAAGIARPEPSAQFGSFEKWLADGNQAGMNFLVRTKDKRKDIREIEPWVRSVIVVAAQYPLNKDPGSGFSCYSRGRDYHIVIREKLDLLADAIRKEKPAIRTRALVDTAPLFEREYAVRAGIGWRGKQGQIINKDLGCCLFLGELLLDIDITPDSPCENLCGGCVTCKESCPNGAITAAGLVDARKCISYLTIEHKGDFTPEQGALIGKSVFGCDICTAVCPYNKARKECVMPEFTAGEMPSADEIIAMTGNEFDGRFKDTTVHRTGLERLQRNARHALANQR